MSSSPFLSVLPFLGLFAPHGTIPGPEPTVRAQGACYICETWSDWEGFAWHKFGSLSNDLFNGPSHTNLQEGRCDQIHLPCGGETFQKHGGFDRLEQLVASRDWVGLKTLVEVVHTVLFNPNRNALQVMSCDGAIIGSYQLPQEAVSILAVE